MSFHTYIQHLPRVDALEAFDRETALAAGMKPHTATTWSQLSAVYFAPVRHSKQQRKARERARAGRFTVEQLALIENRLKHIENEGERWRLRLTLLRHTGRYASLEAAAKLLVPKEKKSPKDSISFSRSVEGKRRMTVTYDERLLADLEAALRKGVDPSKALGPQLLANFVALLRDGKSIPAAAPTPVILVPAEDHLRVLEGTGDDLVFGLTDGTTMTGAEYLKHAVADTLQLALIHPEEGAINLYRGQRHANKKQRILASVMSPVCLVPGCRHGADHCEVHHIEAWKNGGETNVKNLAMVCPYHNRTNDDDAELAKRGRIEFLFGAPVWVSPRGYAVLNPYHPYGAKQLLFAERG